MTAQCCDPVAFEVCLIKEFMYSWMLGTAHYLAVTFKAMAKAAPRTRMA